MSPDLPSSSVSDLLRVGLAELDHPRRDERTTIDALDRLCSIVAAWAPRLNLTGHHGAEAIARDLVLDAAALERVMPDADSIADIGSGAGFPGLPLAILRPAARITLVESRERRHHFQRHAIRKLRLQNALALRGRAELLPVTPHACAIAQAAARAEFALDWLTRWLAPGGYAVIPGSEASPAGRLAVPPGWNVRLVPYQVPLGGRRRMAWIGQAP